MVNIKQIRSDIAGPILYQGSERVTSSTNFMYSDTGLSIQTGGYATAILDIGGSTTTKASFRLRTGVDKSNIATPLSGSLHFDGTDLWLYANGAWGKVNGGSGTVGINQVAYGAPVTGIITSTANFQLVDNVNGFSNRSILSIAQLTIGNAPGDNYIQANPGYSLNYISALGHYFQGNTIFQDNVKIGSGNIFSNGAFAQLQIVGNVSAGGTGYAILNTATNGWTMNLMGRDNANAFGFGYYNNAVAGNYTGTSIPISDTAFFQAGSGYDRPLISAALYTVNISGTTGTNYGSRLDSTGYRIAPITSLHVGNSFPFEVPNMYVTGGANGLAVISSQLLVGRMLAGEYGLQPTAGATLSLFSSNSLFYYKVDAAGAHVISSSTLGITGNTTINANGAPLSLNSTNSNSNKLAFKDNGTLLSAIGADATRNFIVTDNLGSTTLFDVRPASVTFGSSVLNFPGTTNVLLNNAGNNFIFDSVNYISQNRNLFGVPVSIGPNLQTPTSWLQIEENTAARASFRLKPSTVTVTSPQEGEFWYDNQGIKIKASAIRLGNTPGSSTETIIGVAGIQFNSTTAVGFINMRTADSNFNNYFGDGAFEVGSSTTAGYIIGNTSNAPVGIFTNNLPRVIISASGNVNIGTGTPDYTSFLNIVQNLNNAARITIKNSNVGNIAYEGLTFSEDANNYFSIVRLNSGFAGNLPGTSIAYANSGYITAAKNGSGDGSAPITTQGSIIYNLAGITATNYGTRLDPNGFRIDQLSNLHTSNSYIFQAGTNMTWNGNQFSLLNNSNMTITGTNSSTRLLITSTTSTGLEVDTTTGYAGAFAANGTILYTGYRLTLGSSVRDILVFGSATASSNLTGAGQAMLWQMRASDVGSGFGNLRDTGRISNIFEDATDSSERTAFVFSAMTGGTLAERFRVGGTLSTFTTPVQIGAGTSTNPGKLTVLGLAAANDVYATIENLNDTGYVSLHLIEGGLDSQLRQFGDSFLGVFPGTSINAGGFLSLQAHANGARPIWQLGSWIGSAAGTTSTNYGTRLDATGYRIGALSTLQNSNTVAFEIDFTSNNIKFYQSGSSTVITTSQGFDVLGGGDLTLNSSAGNIYNYKPTRFGDTSGIYTPIARVDIQAGTTSVPQLRLRSGVAPTTPAAGDIYNDTGIFTFQGGLKVSNQAGTGDRIVQVDSTGLQSATVNINYGWISDTTTINDLINPANWDITGNYIGAAITGTYQDQRYYDGNYFYWAVADNEFIRMIRG
jgi:hypothetical protein